MSDDSRRWTVDVSVRVTVVASEPATAAMWVQQAVAERLPEFVYYGPVEDERCAPVEHVFAWGVEQALSVD